MGVMATNCAYVNLDLDGVVGNYNDTFRRYAARILGVPAEEAGKAFPEPRYYSFVKSGWFHDVEMYQRVHEAAVNLGMFKEMEVFPGAVVGINKIQQAGIKIRVCTSRFVVPRQNLRVIQDTAEFLDSHAIPVDEYVFANAKSSIKSEMSIDDSPANIDAYAGAGMDVIVFSQPYNSEYDPSLTDGLSENIVARTSDWGKIADIVIKRLAR